MPSIHYMNPPPNPFWDFAAQLENHPFFGSIGQNPRYNFRGQSNVPPQDQQRKPDAAEPLSEKASTKQPTVENETQDPPEVDPSTVKAQFSAANNPYNHEVPEAVRDMPFRGRGRFANAFEDGTGEQQHRGPGCRGRGAHHGPPPFAFGRRGRHGLIWAQGGPFAPEHAEPGHEHRRGCHPHHGGRGHHHGPHSHGPHPHGPPQSGSETHAQPPHPEHRRCGPGGFDLSSFLNNLGTRLGVDLSGAAENAATPFTAPRHTRSNDADFEPRADIFDTASSYTVHVSLPGAKKEDIGVDYDGENSVLKITGVVHRPGVDEALLSKLVVDGRKRETGVFEKAVRLGTKRDPASIDVAAITAKMTDGVLVVNIPKVEIKHSKREVPVSGATTPSPVREAQAYEDKQSEHETPFAADANAGANEDADQEMYDATAVADVTREAKGKQKESGYTHEQEHTEEKTKKQDVHDDNRSETVGFEHKEDQLPRYEAEDLHGDGESDWEKYSDEEGEYVKIDVN